MSCSIPLMRETAQRDCTLVLVRILHKNVARPLLPPSCPVRTAFRGRPLRALTRSLTRVRIGTERESATSNHFPSCSNLQLKTNYSSSHPLFLLELFDRKVGVGVNANLAGDAHGLHGQILGIEFRMLHKRARGGERESSAGTDGHQTVVRLDDVAIAGKHESALGVGNNEQGFQMAKRAVLAPFLSQLDRGFLEISGKLLKLAFEALKKCNRIGRGAGETGNDLVVIKAARLARGVLHDVIAHGHLAIGDEHHLVVLAYAQNRGAVHLWALLAITHPLIIAPEESERQNRRSAEPRLAERTERRRPWHRKFL